MWLDYYGRGGKFLSLVYWYDPIRGREWVEIRHPQGEWGKRGEVGRLFRWIYQVGKNGVPKIDKKTVKRAKELWLPKEILGNGDDVYFSVGFGKKGFSDIPDEHSIKSILNKIYLTLKIPGSKASNMKGIIKVNGPRIYHPPNITLITEKMKALALKAENDYEKGDIDSETLDRIQERIDKYSKQKGVYTKKVGTMRWECNQYGAIYLSGLLAIGNGKAGVCRECKNLMFFIRHGKALQYCYRCGSSRERDKRRRDRDAPYRRLYNRLLDNRNKGKIKPAEFEKLDRAAKNDWEKVKNGIMLQSDWIAKHDTKYIDK